MIHLVEGPWKMREWRKFMKKAGWKRCWSSTKGSGYTSLALNNQHLWQLNVFFATLYVLPLAHILLTKWSVWNWHQPYTTRTVTKRSRQFCNMLMNDKQTFFFRWIWPKNVCKWYFLFSNSQTTPWTHSHLPRGN